MANYDPNNPTGSAGSPYDVLRSRARQQSDANRGQSLEALQRRYAAMGNLNSGSAIKQEQELNRQSGEDLENQLGNINLQEQEGANQRNFQRSMMNEQLSKQQEFQGKQNELARQFQGTQNEAERSLREKLANLENTARMRQLDLEFQNSDLERQAMYFNQDMQNWQKVHSGGLLGGGGFLGTGFGAGQIGAGSSGLGQIIGA